LKTCFLLPREKGERRVSPHISSRVAARFQTTHAPRLYDGDDIEDVLFGRKKRRRRRTKVEAHEEHPFFSPKALLGDDDFDDDDDDFDDDAVRWERWTTTPRRRL